MRFPSREITSPLSVTTLEPRWRKLPALLIRACYDSKVGIACALLERRRGPALQAQLLHNAENLQSNSVQWLSLAKSQGRHSQTRRLDKLTAVIQRIGNHHILSAASSGAGRAFHSLVRSQVLRPQAL